MTTSPGEPATFPSLPPAAPRPSRWRTVLAVAAQVALILLVAEGILRLVYQPPDLRPRVALFPHFPDIYIPNRDLGWVLKPNLDWTGPDVAIPFRTDAFGHRVQGAAESAAGADPATPLVETTAATVDCLGDSSTFGFGVPAEQTYPAQLEARLRASTGDPTVRVRNFGVPGYTSYEARLLAERDRPHAPVTIVWVGFNDHFPALPSHTRSRSLLRRRIAYACFRSRACAFFFDRLTRRPPDAPPPIPPTPDAYYPDVPPDDYVEQLVRTIRALRAAGSEPILLVYPSLSVDAAMRLEIGRYWKQPMELVDANLAAHTQYQTLTRQVAARENVRVIDLAPAFDAVGNPGLHFDWVHPNAAGQELIARLVEPEVRAALAKRAAGAGSASNP